MLILRKKINIYYISLFKSNFAIENIKPRSYMLNIQYNKIYCIICLLCQQMSMIFI